MTRFERTWTVRFSDADPFGIAYYPRIVEAVHGTAEAFADSVGHPFRAMAADGYGLVVAEVDLEFGRQLEAGDEVTIALTVDLGETSARFDYAATVDGEAAFEGYEQRVYVSAETGRPVEIPDDLRAALASATPE